MTERERGGAFGWRRVLKKHHEHSSNWQQCCSGSVHGLDGRPWLTAGVCIPLPLVTSLSLGKSMNLLFPHLESADDNDSYVIGFLQILSVLILVNHLAQCLIHCKYYLCAY